MKITILCSAETHPVNAHLERWISERSNDHEVDLVRTMAQLSEGDILFLISCSEIIGQVDREKYSNVLVLHASDLPKGRGWSPHLWQIIGGAEQVTMSLLEAEDAVDTGRIWQKERIDIPKHALWDEVNDLIFNSELKLMSFAVDNFSSVTPSAQSDPVEASYFSKRSPADSNIDARKTIEEQFDLLRVCDPDRFPAYFEMYGHRYALRLVKVQ